MSKPYRILYGAADGDLNAWVGIFPADFKEDEGGGFRCDAAMAKFVYIHEFQSNELLAIQTDIWAQENKWDLESLMKSPDWISEDLFEEFGDYEYNLPKYEEPLPLDLWLKQRFKKNKCKVRAHIRSIGG